MPWVIEEPEDRLSAPRISWGDAALSGAADAFTFGFGDELQGLFGGDTEKARQYQELARAERPGAFLSGQFGGSLAGGGGLGLLARGTRLASMLRNTGGPLSRILVGAGAGAAGGAAYGTGEGTGGIDDPSRYQFTLQGLGLGAAGGAAGQAIFGEALPTVFGAAFRGASPEARGADVVGKALQRFGVDDQSLLDNLSTQATLGGQVADLPSFYQLARGAGARPGMARDEFRTAREKMAEGSGIEAIDDLWRTLAGRPVVVKGARRSAGEIVGEQADNMRARASPLYDEVDLGRVNPALIPSEMRELMRRHPQIFGPAQERARAAMLSATGSDAVDETSPLYWRTLLSEARSEVSEGLRAAKFPGSPMSETRGYRGMGSARAAATIDHFSDFVRNLLGPKFRQADNIWAGGRSFEDAVERGYEAMRSTVNDLELSDTLKFMRQLQAKGRVGELEGMRLGALQRLSDNIENADPMTGRADALRGVMRNAGQRRVMLGLFTAKGAPPGTPTVRKPGLRWNPKTNQYVRVRAGRSGGDRGPASSLTSPIRLRDMNKLIERLEARQQQFRNTVQTGIEFNSITADKLAAYQSQLARTRPTPSNALDAVWQLFTREAADKYDEDVSNQILRAVNTPAIDVMTQLRTLAGGAKPTVETMKDFMRGQGLLARGARRRRELDELRPRRLIEALTSGAYYPVAGAGIGEYGT